MSEAGTIDITDAVKSMKSAWVEWCIAYINGLEAVAPGAEWLNLPIVNDLEEAGLRAALGAIADGPIMFAFFENTIIRKSSQALDFTAAVAALNNAPEEISDEDYKKLEEARMAAFRAFVPVTN